MKIGDAGPYRDGRQGDESVLKEIVASKAAKLIAACVCPVVGTAALTVSVPEVRERVHRATAPRAEAAPAARRAPAEAVAAAEAVCPTDTPVILAARPFAPFVAAPEALPLAFLPADARGPGGGGGGFFVGSPIPGVPIGGFVPGVDVEPPPPPPVIPEPATWLQLMVGFGVIGGATRFSYRQQMREKRDPR